MSTRIIFADDHRLLLDALKTLVEPEFNVVGAFDDCAALIENAPMLRPDIIVLDVSMPGINGFTAGLELKKLLPKTRLIFLTMHRDLEMAGEAFRLGASGYVIKYSAGNELITALRTVARGGYYASPVLTEGMMGSFVQNFKRMKSQEENRLTGRQTSVLQLLSDGMTMKEVSRSLHITPRTVAFHKYTIMEKLGVKSNAELLSFAYSKLPHEVSI